MKKLIFTAGLLLLASSLFAEPPSVSVQRQSMANCALAQHDVPYVWGGTTKEGFDCSGFVQYVALNGIQWKENGKIKHLKVVLPRNANEMYLRTIPITTAEREAGDLMFFKDDKNSPRITHVGIYLGVYHENPDHPIPRFKEFEGKRVFISALSEGQNRGIQLRPIDNKYWVDHFYSYGRIVPTSKEFAEGKRAIVRK